MRRPRTDPPDASAGPRQLPLFRVKPGDTSPPHSQRTLDAQVTEYLVHLARTGKARHTLAATRSDLEQLTTASGDPLVDEISSGNLHAFVDGLVAERANQPASLRRKVATVKAFFRYLVREGRLHDDPSATVPYPELPEREADPLFPWEVDRLLADVPSEAHRALLLAMLDAGLKREELLALRVSDVRLTPRTEASLAVQRGLAAKKIRARVVPLTDRLAVSLAEVFRELPSDQPVFQLSTRGVDFVVKEAGRRADLARVGALTPQRLRDTFAVRWLGGRLPLEWAETDADARRLLEARHDRELTELLGLAPGTLAITRYRRAALRQDDRAEAQLLPDGEFAPSD